MVNEAHIGKFIIDYYTTPLELLQKLLAGVEVVHREWLTNTHQIIIAKSPVFDLCDEREVPGYYELTWVPEINGLTATRIPDPPLRIPEHTKHTKPIQNMKLDTSYARYNNSQRFHAQIDVDHATLKSGYEYTEMFEFIKESLSHLLTDEIHRLTKGTT